MACEHARPDRRASVAIKRPVPRIEPMSQRDYPRLLTAALIAAGASGMRISAAADAPKAGDTLTGRAALGDWTTDAPGVRRKITVAELAIPYDTPSANNHPMVVRRPEGAWPK